MNKKLLIIATFAGFFACNQTILAHDHERKIEELQFLAEQQGIIIIKKNKIIAAQQEAIECLEAELEKAKHKLHEKHRFHELKKMIKALFE